MDSTATALKILLEDLTSTRTDAERQALLQQVEAVVNYAWRTLSPDTFSNLINVTSRDVSEYINSDSAAAQIAGIHFLHQLVDSKYKGNEILLVRYANFLRTLLTSEKGDEVIRRLAAKALGELAKLGGPVSEGISFELERALERLTAPREEWRLHCAVLVLRRLAVSVPSLFAQHFDRFFHAIFPALIDPALNVRHDAANALAAVLIAVHKRQSPNRQEWCKRLLQKAEATLSGSVKDHAHVHGSLLTIGQLLEHSAGTMLDNVSRMSDLVFKYCDSKNEHVRRTVIAIVPLLAKRNPKIFVAKHHSTALEYLLGSLKKSSDKSVAYQALGGVAIYLGPKYATAALRPFLSRLVVIIEEGLKVKRSGDLCLEALTCVGCLAQALGPVMDPYLRQLLGSMFTAGLCKTLVDVLSEIVKHVPTLLINVQERLLHELSMLLLGRPYQYPAGPATLLAPSNMPAILRGMASAAGGSKLQGASAAASMALGDDLPGYVTRAAQDPRVAATAAAMSDGARPTSWVSPPGIAATAAAATPASEAAHARVLLALKTLSTFDFRGVPMLPFVREAVLPYASEGSLALRAAALQAAAAVLRRPTGDTHPALDYGPAYEGLFPRPESAAAAHAAALGMRLPWEQDDLDADGVDTSLLPYGMDDEDGTTLPPALSAAIMQQPSSLVLPVVMAATGPTLVLVEYIVAALVMAAVGEGSAEVRLAAWQQLTPELDGLLCQPAFIRRLSMSLHDESFAVRQAAVQVLGRLATHNPTAVLPALRCLLLELLTELEYASASRSVGSSLSPAQEVIARRAGRGSQASSGPGALVPAVRKDAAMLGAARQALPSPDVAAKLLGCLVSVAAELVMPYLAPIMKALLPRLGVPASNQGMGGVPMAMPMPTSSASWLRAAGPELISSVLSTLGEVSRVGGQAVVPYLPVMLPPMIGAMGDDASGPRRQAAAVATLGTIVSHTGAVMLPYVHFPQLLSVLIDLMRPAQDGNWELTEAALRTFGCLGALDPHRQLLIAANVSAAPRFRVTAALEARLGSGAGAAMVPVGWTSSAGAAAGAARHAGLSPELADVSKKLRDIGGAAAGHNARWRGDVRALAAAAAGLTPGAPDEPPVLPPAADGAGGDADAGPGDDDDPYHAILTLHLPASQILPSMVPETSDFYPTVALAALLRIMRDPGLTTIHAAAVEAATWIFRSLAERVETFLPHVVPAFLLILRRRAQATNVLDDTRAAESGLREAVLQQLGLLTSHARAHIRPYTADIMSTLAQSWPSAMPATLRLLEELARAVPDEFGARLPILMPHIYASLEYPTQPSRATAASLKRTAGAISGMAAMRGRAAYALALDEQWTAQNRPELLLHKYNAACAHDSADGSEAGQAGADAASTSSTSAAMPSAREVHLGVEIARHLLSTLSLLSRHFVDQLEMLVPFITALMERLDVGQALRVSAAATLGMFVSTGMPVASMASRLVHVLARVISGVTPPVAPPLPGVKDASAFTTPDRPAGQLVHTAADAMTWIGFALRGDFVVFMPIVRESLARAGMVHDPLDAICVAVVEGSRLPESPSVLADSLVEGYVEAGELGAAEAVADAVGAASASLAAVLGIGPNGALRRPAANSMDDMLMADSVHAMSSLVVADINGEALHRAWQNDSCRAPEDWYAWLERLAVALITQSSAQALRACASLAQVYNPLAAELFNHAFVSVWVALDQHYQEPLIQALEFAFSSRTLPGDVLQTLLALAEYIEHDETELPIDSHLLGRLAERSHAYAKALRYKELEFRRQVQHLRNSRSADASGPSASVVPAASGGSSSASTLGSHTTSSSDVAFTDKSAAAAADVIEALISINNQLDQPEAAMGVLSFAQNAAAAAMDGSALDLALSSIGGHRVQNHCMAPEFAPEPVGAARGTGAAPAAVRELEVKERWYEKLGRWDEALDAYEQRLAGMQTEIRASKLFDRKVLELQCGRMRCYRELGEWNQLYHCVQDAWPRIPSASVRAEVALHGARASWALQNWGFMRACVQHAPHDSEEGVFYRAILAVQDREWQAATRHIKTVRKLLSKRLPTLLAESYARAYRQLVTLQQCTELEEIVAYKQLDEAAAAAQLAHLQRVWSVRLRGMSRTVPVWHRTLAVRSLVHFNGPGSEDVHAWIKFAGLCRRSGRSSLAQSILSSLSWQGGQSFGNAPAGLFLTGHPMRHGFNTSPPQGVAHAAGLPSPMLGGMPDAFAFSAASRLTLDTLHSDHGMAHGAGMDMTAVGHPAHAGLANSEISLGPGALDANGDAHTCGSAEFEQLGQVRPHPAVEYALAKHLWENDERDAAVAKLEQLVHWLSRSQKSRADGTERYEFGNCETLPPAEEDDLQVKMQLRLGRWRLRQLEDARRLDVTAEWQSIMAAHSPANPDRRRGSLTGDGARQRSLSALVEDFSSVLEPVLSCFHSAVKAAPEYARVWHEWAMSNFVAAQRLNALQHQIQTLGSGRAAPAADGTTENAVASAAAAAAAMTSQAGARPSVATTPHEAGRSKRHSIGFGFAAVEGGAIRGAPGMSTVLDEATAQRLQAAADSHVVHAVRGFYESIRLGVGHLRSTVLQDLLRLLTLWFSFGGTDHPHVRDAVEQGLSVVPINTWLRVVPQLIARIHLPDQAIKRLLHALLTRLGQSHPQALVYPLTVASKATFKPRAIAARALLAEVQRSWPLLVDQADLVSKELIRVAITWSEGWQSGLEAASRAWFGNKDPAGMLAALDPLYEQLHKPEAELSAHEQAFKTQYSEQLLRAEKWIDEYRRTGKREHLSSAWHIYYALFQALSQAVQGVQNLDLPAVSPPLTAATDLDLSMPGTYAADGPTVRIASFSPHITVLSSKQKPRKVSMLGSNGRWYRFLLKGHEDLRQDERVMQLFGLVNTLLASNAGTGKQDLAIRRYSVTPLSQNVGVVGWVAAHDTLQELVEAFRVPRKVLMNIEHRVVIQTAPQYDTLPLLGKLELFTKVMTNTMGADLAQMLWLRSPTSESWLARRCNYTRSLAVMSMVGYLLGLGDRHPSNLMLDRQSGKVVHIDFGDCFEVAARRDKFPERVPFRLTRMLIRAMEVSGIEGNYRSTAESVMSVLREHRDSVLAVLEAFVYDPLINWRLLKRPAMASNAEGTARLDSQAAGEARPGAAPAAGSSAAPAAPDSDRPLHRPNSTSDDKAEPDILDGDGIAVEALNERAVEVLARIKAKLTGRDYENDPLTPAIGGPDAGRATYRPEAAPEEGAAAEDPLVVADQVQRLIEQATSRLNLCQMYGGWCPYW